MLKLRGLHHVRFDVRDVDASERFCLDFGLTLAERRTDLVFMRGAGTDAYSFVAARGAETQMTGLAFLAESVDELERAHRDFGASALRDLDGPGGGVAVTLRDPDGIGFDLIADVASVSPHQLRDDLVYNTAHHKERRGARQLMPEQAPPQVLRLGHVGIFVSDVERSLRWLHDTLGIVPSDSVYVGSEEQKLVSFCRIDRGQEWVDHHSLAVFKGAPIGAQHLSFEVQDFEAQALAHEYLMKRGWEPLWGMGRHALGSHIFDVWWEPNDIRFENYSDTDLCTAETPHQTHSMGEHLTRWGPKAPPAYFMPRAR